MRQEQVYPIEGLEFPDWETVSSIGENEDAADYTAVQLFRQTARRNLQEFIITSEDAHNLARICRLVAGMPLAIELAAGWVDMLSLADIASELQQGLDLLETEMRDVPERHRSVRAAIDYSWQRLEKREQAAFAALSVFRGGFTRQAAEAVAGANLRILARLVNKSFLRFDQSQNRYQVHELLRQFGAEMLGRDEGNQRLLGETAVREQHSAYFCEALAKWETDLNSERQPVALSELETEYENFLVAWHWAVDKAQAKRLYMAVNGLVSFFDFTARVNEALQILRVAHEKLESYPSDPAALSARARIELWQGYLAWKFVSKHQGNRQLQELLDQLNKPIFANVDSRWEQAMACLYLGRNSQLEYGEAQSFLEKSLSLFQLVNDKYWAAHAQYQLSYLAQRQGDYNLTEKLLMENIRQFEALGNPIQIGYARLDLANVAWWKGDHDKAKRQFWEIFEDGQAGLNQAITTSALRYLGHLHYFLGEFEQCRQVCEQIYAIYYEHDDLFRLGKTLVHLGVANCYGGDFVKGIKHYEEAQAILAAEVGQSAVPVLAEAYAFIGRYEQARTQATKIQPDLPVSYREVMAWLALIEGQFEAVVHFAQQNVEAYNKGQFAAIRGDWATVQVPLVLALYRLGQRLEAEQHVVTILQTCLEIRAFVPLMQVVPMIAVMLAEQPEQQWKERAVALYALAETQPFIANSQLFADVAGKVVRTHTAVLSPETIAAAQALGQTLDWWQTAESLLTELADKVA